MAKRSNGKASDEQVKILIAIEERIGHLVDGQQTLVAGQRSLVAGQRSLVEGQQELVKGQTHLAQRIDNLLQFLSDHWRDHDRRLAALEQRVAKAGI